MATKKFDADDFGAFLKLLPAQQDGIALRHAIQVRHESFAVPEFVALCRAAGVAIVYADSAEYPAIADVTGDFVYARLENAARGRGDRLYRRASSTAGRRPRGPGRPAARPTGCPMSTRPRRRRRRATRSCSSSTAPRCARRPGAMALIERLK